MYIIIVIIIKVLQCITTWLYRIANRELGRTKNSATADIAHICGYYALQGNSRSLILIPIESPYPTSYYLVPLPSYRAVFVKAIV